MQFSVLMSVYIREQAVCLDMALESILVKQTVKPTELVLVADGPLTEELYSIIEKYKALFENLHLVQLPQNEGLGKALNEGLKHCSYEWVARMDSDDISTPNRFEKQIDCVDKNPDIQVVGSWISEFVENPNDIVSVKKVPETQHEIYIYAQGRNPMNHPVVFFKKSEVLRVGGYEHCPMFEDYWLWVRLLKNRVQFYNIQESLLLFRANNLMYERRGGWDYVRYEYRFFNKARHIQFITTFIFFKNLMIRLGFRLVPNKIRALLYKKILRK